jgi:hypothetical protein
MPLWPESVVISFFWLPLYCHVCPRLIQRTSPIIAGNADQYPDRSGFGFKEVN